MKLLLTFTLFTLLSSTTFGQNRLRTSIIQSSLEKSCNDSCTIPTREIIDVGLASWRAVYQKLAELQIIDYVNHRDTTTFSMASLESLYGQELDSTSVGTIVFRYYMTADQQSPKFAIGNCGDTCRYLIKIDGKDSIVTIDERPQLIEEFARWRVFLNERKGGLIYVTSYNYCWGNILKGINSSQSKGYLYIENVAHTVSPFDKRYQMPLTNQYEGYVTFDLALAFSEKIFLKEIESVGLGSPSVYSDFAAPCPKICYESSPCR